MAAIGTSTIKLTIDASDAHRELKRLRRRLLAPLWLRAYSIAVTSAFLVALFVR